MSLQIVTINCYNKSEQINLHFMFLPFSLMVRVNIHEMLFILLYFDECCDFVITIL